jgi:hypothetical protein
MTLAPFLPSRATASIMAGDGFHLDAGAFAEGWNSPVAGPKRRPEHTPAGREALIAIHLELTQSQWWRCRAGTPGGSARLAS